MFIFTALLTALAGSVICFACYIGMNNSFLKPLSKEQTDKYVKQMMDGDQYARDKLIEHNLRLVAHIAKKYSQAAGSDAEDLMSIGTIGLIKGITSFSSEKGTKLVTYAARCIENEILMHLRTQKKRQNEISINELIGTDSDGNEITFLDILQSSENDICERVETKVRADDILKKMKTVLTDREREILCFRYGLDGSNIKTQNEIASMYKISRSYVSRIEKSAIEKLRCAHHN